MYLPWKSVDSAIKHKGTQLFDFVFLFSRVHDDCNVPQNVYLFVRTDRELNFSCALIVAGCITSTNLCYKNYGNSTLYRNLFDLLGVFTHISIKPLRHNTISPHCVRSTFFTISAWACCHINILIPGPAAIASWCLLFSWKGTEIYGHN